MANWVLASHHARGSRFNADLAAKDEQLIKAGKAPRQAITAVMRKLIILAHALLKNGIKWQEREICLSLKL